MTLVTAYHGETLWSIHVVATCIDQKKNPISFLELCYPQTGVRSSSPSQLPTLSSLVFQDRIPFALRILTGPLYPPEIPNQAARRLHENLTKMAPAFVPSTPLTARTQLQGSALCQSRPTTRRAARTSVQMVAEKKKDESIMDWLYGKFMHNALWDGDQEIGYEPFWKEIQTAREEKKKEVYDSMDAEKNQ